MPSPHETTNRRSSAEADRRRIARRTAAQQLSQQGQSLGGAVTFHLRALEPMVAWALAAYTFWASLVLSNAGGAQWPMVAFAAAIAAWARQYPARVQSTLLLRAGLLIVGAAPMLLSLESGGPAGAFLVWPCLTLVFYNLLLARTWALGLGVLAVAGYAAAGWLLRADVAWVSLANGLAFLVSAAWLAQVFGEKLRVSGEKTESTLRDDRTQLYNETGLFVHGAQLLDECRRKGRPFSMVLLHGSDLKEIPEIVGRKAATGLFDQMVKVIGAVPTEGIAARIEGAEFVLLLPGQDAKGATAQVHQRLGNPPKVELRIKGKPVSVVLDMVAGQLDAADHELETFYDALHRSLQQQAPTQGIQTHASLLDIEIVSTPSPRRAAAPTVPMELQPRSSTRPRG